MTEKTPLNELIEWCDSFKNPQFQPTPLNLKEKILTLLPKERQNLIDAADSKFVILEKVIDSNGAKVTYQSGKDYVKDKFGI